MKTLQDLIEAGIRIKATCTHHEAIPYVGGTDYAEWLTYCERFLREQFGDDPQVSEFSEIAKIANNRGPELLDRLIGILKAFESIPLKTPVEGIDMTLEKIFRNFHRCAKTILNRHGNRATLEINDEYDVQDLLQGILRLFVDDVRPEDCVPSYAGSNSRTDFHLPQYEMYIETKMTREGLRDKEIGEQLVVDIARYGDKCRNLVCFIYDKGSFLKNPYGLVSDLEGLSTERVQVRVYISPI